MKRRFAMAALAAVTMFSVQAQRPMGGGSGSAVGGSNRLDFLAGYLSLTDSQKTTAQAIFDAASTASATARGQLTAARDPLRQAIKDNKTEAELDRLAAAVGAIEGQLLAIDAKAQAKFYALLTAEQKAKYDQLGNRGGVGTGPRGGRSE